MWFEVGNSSRSGPSSFSNQRSRSRVVRGGRGAAGRVEHALELRQRDPLLFAVPRDGIGLARELGLECLAGREELAPVVVETRADSVRERAELVAVAVTGQHGELRLRIPQRHLLAAPVDPRGQDPVLELVLPCRELGGDDPGLAGLSQPVEQLALVAARRLLGGSEHVDLRGREEVAEALDDRGLLGDLLLAHPHGAPLFGALEEVARKALFVVGRGSDRGDAHGADTT